MTRSPTARARRIGTLCRLGQLALLAATVVACAALVVGLGATRNALQQAATSVETAEPQVQDLAVMTQRLTAMTKTLGTGLNDSAKTIEVLSRLTGTVGQVVDVVAPFSGNIRQAAEDLKQSRATFDALHESTLATQAELTAAQPDLDRAARAAAELPGLMRDARLSLADQDSRLGLLTALGCGAIVLFALVLLVVLHSLAVTARLSAISLRTD